MRRATDDASLKAIKDNNMIFISAQPDTTYFHWQVEIYMYQFAKHGIIDRCYVLFGYSGEGPTEYAKRLMKKYATIRCYKDERKSNEYSPTIRPYLLSKFFDENPDLGKNVFYHDSDIFITKLPNFSLMLNDKNGYVSDTISYIGYDYIKNCSDRYRAKYRNLPEADIFYGMCKTVDIDPELVRKNQKNSGGAQYLLKNIDGDFWRDCEKKCMKLYDYLSKYEKSYPIQHHIQKWTTDMWVVLWLYWKTKGPTLIHKELDFSWATGSIADYNKLNIFHLAGITSANCKDKFFKGKYTKVTVFDAYIRDKSIFDHINKNNATYEYVNVIREYINDVYSKELGVDLSSIHREIKNNTNNTYKLTVNNKPRSLTSPTETINNANNNANINNKTRRFRIISNKTYSMGYNLDETKQCCGKTIWRSDNKQYIIFWNGICWILTYAKFEHEIGEKCGGIISNTGTNPYDEEWNTELKIIIQK